MILVTGATSQLGEVIIKKLSESNEKVRCFVRKSSNIECLKYKNVEFAYGDFDDYSSIKNALEGVDYVIHIGGIWYAKDFLSVLESQNRKIKKLVFVGSTSRFQKVNSKDPKEIDLVKKMISSEDLINNSKQNTVIIRPTMLYGIDKDKNILILIKFMNKFHVFPIIGEGNGLKQPVHVYDVADAVLKTLKDENLVKNAYNIPGANAIEYKKIIMEIKKNLNTRIFVFNIPMCMAKLGFRIYKFIRPNTIINIDMVSRVGENYIFDYKSASEDFGYSPMTFEKGIELQVSYLRKKGTIKN